EERGASLAAEEARADRGALPIAARETRPSALRAAQAAALRPDVIPLSLGLPAAELFPRAALAAAARRVLADDPAALQYTTPFEPLKTHVVALMAARGVACRESQVLLTNGAQQANDLLVRLFLPAAGAALVEPAPHHG